MQGCAHHTEVCPDSPARGRGGTVGGKGWGVCKEQKKKRTKGPKGEGGHGDRGLELGTWENRGNGGTRQMSDIVLLLNQHAVGH